MMGGLKAAMLADKTAGVKVGSSAFSKAAKSADGKAVLLAVLSVFGLDGLLAAAMAAKKAGGGKR